MPTQQSRWIPHLPQTLRDRGFEAIEEHRSKTPRHRLLADQQTSLVALEEFVSMAYRGEELREQRAMLGRASEEVRGGVAWNHERVVVVGRKPGG